MEGNETKNKDLLPVVKRMKLQSNPTGFQQLSKNKLNKYGLLNSYSTGKMAASFTSTVMTPVFKDELQPFTDQQIREEKWKLVKG